MTVDLDVSINQLSNAQSAQLAGLATGCIFFIPFTIKYGRRLTYLVSTAILAAAAWWTSSMHSYAELIATAVITGLAGAINETAVQMTVMPIRIPWSYLALSLMILFCNRLPIFFSFTNEALPTVSILLP